MRGNGAALFEMFSYLILCPSTGASLIRLARPRVPTVPCSPARPVQLDPRCCRLPCFHTGQLQFISPCSRSNLPRCPLLGFFQVFPFFFFSLPFLVLGDTEKNLSGGFLCGDEDGRVGKRFVQERQGPA